MIPIENDNITIIDDEIPNIYHVISKKIGELGIIFKPNEKSKFCFRQTDPNKYLKAWHMITITHEMNIKNGVKRNVTSL